VITAIPAAAACGRSSCSSSGVGAIAMAGGPKLIIADAIQAQYLVPANDGSRTPSGRPRITAVDPNRTDQASGAV
jgi:hypothetical protein